jgi:hypothetical protein
MEPFFDSSPRTCTRIYRFLHKLDTLETHSKQKGITCSLPVALIVLYILAIARMIEERSTEKICK